MKPAPGVEREDSRGYRAGNLCAAVTQKLSDGYVGSFNELFPTGRRTP